MCIIFKNDSCCSTQSSTVTNLYSSPASSSNPRFSVPAPTPTVRTLDGEKIARKILPLSSPTSKAKIEKSPPFLSTTTTTTELCFDKRQENDAGDKRLARLLLTFMFSKRRRFLADRQILRIAAICYESGGGGNEMIANNNGPGVNFPLSNDRRFNRTTTNWLRNFLFRNPSLLRFVDGINGHYSSWQTKKLSDDEFNDCAKFCRFYF
uniref:Uncharacterized protein n=1 Tax=Romanomermis culicivorax TaxID=13658 RepID=A0A915IB90_ROMCU